MSEAMMRLDTNEHVPQTRLMARRSVNTGTSLPSVAPIENGAGTALHTTPAVPQSGEVYIGGEHHHANDLAATIQELVALQRQRRFCIKSQSRCDRSVEAFLARQLGFHNDLPETKRAAIWKQVSAVRRAVEKGGEVQVQVEDQLVDDLSASFPLILFSAQARKAWDTHRANVEKQMRALARSLPVWPWVKDVAGFGELGLAIIIGETGDLSGYATKERVWKRLGLAVIAGERQRRVSGEAAIEHGYNPGRRAEVWTIVDSMFRHQWSGAKDNQPAQAKGPFGEVYGRRKAYTEGREGWTPKHRDNDARRIMGKALIEALWKEWGRSRSKLEAKLDVTAPIPLRDVA